MRVKEGNMEFRNYRDVVITLGFAFRYSQIFPAKSPFLKEIKDTLSIVHTLGEYGYDTRPYQNIVRDYVNFAFVYSFRMGQPMYPKRSICRFLTKQTISRINDIASGNDPGGLTYGPQEMRQIQKYANIMNERVRK